MFTRRTTGCDEFAVELEAPGGIRGSGSGTARTPCSV